MALSIFKKHNDLQILDDLMSYVRLLQELAIQHNVPDIFQDNGGKLLQLSLVTGLRLLNSREGNDAEDENGMQYEIKTVNVKNRKNAQFTTHHHLNPTIINKYRKVNWLFAIYNGIELVEIYCLKPEEMEFWFSKWETKWNEDEKDINNPKIPIDYVVKNGIKIHPL